MPRHRVADEDRLTEIKEQYTSLKKELTLRAEVEVDRMEHFEQHDRILVMEHCLMKIYQEERPERVNVR